MKTQLIKLENFNIITNDEEIKEGDFYYNQHDYKVGKYGDNQLPPQSPYVSKVIASTNPEHNLPSIGYNGLKEELDIIDVEKLAENYYNTLGSLGSEYDKVTSINLIIWGFNKSQELNNKKFSLDDIKNAYYTIYENRSGGYIITLSDIIKSLQQPKVFDVEIKTQNIIATDDITILDIEPVVTNNQIKITKIIS